MYEHYWYECVFCRSNKQLNIHHKTYDHIGDERLHELAYVCQPCHQMLHEDPAKLIEQSKHYNKPVRLKVKKKAKKSKKKSSYGKRKKRHVAKKMC